MRWRDDDSRALVSTVTAADSRKQHRQCRVRAFATQAVARRHLPQPSVVGCPGKATTRELDEGGAALGQPHCIGSEEVAKSLLDPGTTDGSAIHWLAGGLELSLIHI